MIAHAIPDSTSLKTAKSLELIVSPCRRREAVWQTDAAAFGVALAEVEIPHSQATKKLACFTPGRCKFSYNRKLPHRTTFGHSADCPGVVTSEATRFRWRN